MFNLFLAAGPCPLIVSNHLPAGFFLLEDKNPRMSNFPRCVKGMVGNAVWHICSVLKIDSQELLLQKGCVIWKRPNGVQCLVGKSTLARGLHMIRKLIFILDCNNVRHGLNKDLTFKAEDHITKLFADAGIIYIASLISPYTPTEKTVISVYMRHCTFGKLSRDEIIGFHLDTILICSSAIVSDFFFAGFTCIDDPYEPPLKSQPTICLAPRTALHSCH
ncbi:hypothetical protein DCAR_0518520 [Daucus carota subsp. sativus]|uniref:APS kinase domain-containing protein n=1 Tax=Daucus carota subsp. sativus TaxID=79200 RepID=A0AAF0X0Q7_DAUCS|nr:hypothetical protein DCAR_0518520 [Daucus carota subsp. sativus]